MMKLVNLQRLGSDGEAEGIDSNHNELKAGRQS